MVVHGIQGQSYATIQRFGNGFAVIVGAPLRGVAVSSGAEQQAALMGATVDAIVEINALGGEAAAKGVDEGMEPWKRNEEAIDGGIEERKEAAKKKIRESFKRALQAASPPIGSVQGALHEEIVSGGAYVFLTLEKALQFAGAFLAGNVVEARIHLDAEAALLKSRP